MNTKKKTAETKRRGRRWLGALAGLTAGVLGTALLMRRGRRVPGKKSIYEQYNRGEADRWARPGMSVTFRAELMPGRDRAARTFRVSEVLPSRRVTLSGFAGEHVASEFEPLR
ncbi:MAG TPA: hypothetical protein VF064_14460, partial [Pyrinomonadaceae bacterium]